MPNEILENFFFFERGYLNANHFAYRGESPILIDTGFIGDFQQTAAIINGIGIDLDHIGLIINTHCHCDHVGGNHAIQARSGCDIALHPRGRFFMENRDDWSTWWRYYNQKAAFFKATRSLQDGETIPIGPHAFEVIHTPGHSADGIVLFNRKEKMLLSSDTLWEKDMAVMTLRVEGETALSAMMNSLERVESLGAKMAFPGHGPPFTGIKEAIARTRQRLKSYILHAEQIGNDLLKKIITYTLLMHRGAREETFFDELMRTEWFKDTVKMYGNGQHQRKYDEILSELLRKGVVVRKEAKLFATVRA
jgi:hydroxyacylglutathione hydrolase